MSDFDDLKEYLDQHYYSLKKLNTRFYKENISKRARNDFQRDYSRILYSGSFRRLQGKMQLFGVESDKFHRNRLTHSLEVAQIARGIAENLRVVTDKDDIYLDDIYVVEACSLAHDLGNPPFGHHGEKILHELSSDIGGFEGNAQTLKILMDIEKKLPDNKGLNLTIRCLLGILKYYNSNERKPIPKKFIYSEHYNMINHFLNSLTEQVLVRTLDVQIVDLADEIAYAAHDLEDALSFKLFTIDEFLYEFNFFMNRNQAYKEAFNHLQGIVLDAKKTAESAKNYRSSEEYGLLLRKEITSNLVHNLIKDIGLVRVNKEEFDITGTRHEYELGFKNLGHLAKGLKKFTFKCINRSNWVQLYEKKGEKVIKGLYEVFMDSKFNNEGILLPVEYRAQEGEHEDTRKRLIIDYIAGMMDSYAMKTFEDFFGKSELYKTYDKEYFMGFNNGER